MQSTSWKHWAIGGVAALTLLAGSFWTADSVLAETPDPAVAAPAAVQEVQPIRFGPDRMERGIRMGDFGETADALLAEALGISVEELQAAQEQAQDAARDAALAQAVADGELTQAQADAIKELDGLWGGRDLGRFRLGMEDHDVYLAEALGITVEELQAARAEALQAGLAQAVADGKITQEQADLMAAGIALKDYMGDKLQGVFEQTVQQAVADGVITQEQADQLLEDGRGFFGRDGFGNGMWGGFPGGMKGRFDDDLRGRFPGGMRDRFDGGMRGGFPGGRWGDSNAPDTQNNSNLYVAPDSLL